VQECCIDLGLLGSQKALSLPPDLGIATVSARAWKVIEEVAYFGYDAFLPFKTAVEKRYFPYTPNWRSIAALNAAISLLEAEGLEAVRERHSKVAEHTRGTVKGMGLSLFPRNESDSANTVTAVYVPQGWTWAELDAALRLEGVVFGGNYGKLAGKVFRIGHMGSQANLDLVSRGLAGLKKVLESKPSLQ